jgi:hypothetical protein
MDEMWSFGDGGWTRVPDWWQDHDKNAEQAMRQAGYDPDTAEQWGSQGVEAVEIIRHGKEDERWLVFLTLGSCAVHTFEIRGLPNLLSMVGNLGSFALANQMRSLEATLDAAIELLAEDSRREYERRHPRRSAR